MALVRVTSAQVWKSSAQTFDRILKLAQESLASSHPELAQRIQSALQSNLHWWSIADLNEREFESLYAAVQMVAKAWAAKVPKSAADLEADSARVARLNEFIGILAADPRTKSGVTLGSGEQAEAGTESELEPKTDGIEPSREG